MSIELDNFEFEYGTAVNVAVTSEAGRSFKLDNRQSKFILRKWAIDKVVFKNRNEERCDYLIEVQHPEKFIYYLIELKGKDIVKACRQITNTITLINIHEDIKQHARIITSGTNKLDIRSNDYLRLDIKMRETGGYLKTYTNQREELI